MGRVCHRPSLYGPSWLWAEFVIGPGLWAEFSSYLCRGGICGPRSFRDLGVIRSQLFLHQRNFKTYMATKKNEILSMECFQNCCPKGHYTVCSYQENWL